MNQYIDKKAGIYLRLMTQEDTDSIIAWRNSDGVRRNFIYQELFTREGHEKWIQEMIDTGRAIQMIICEIVTGNRWAVCIYGILTGSTIRQSMAYFSEKPRPGGAVWALLPQS